MDNNTTWQDLVNFDNPPFSLLSDNQWLYVTAMIEDPSLNKKRVADCIGVSEKTVYNWVHVAPYVEEAVTMARKASHSIVVNSRLEHKQREQKLAMLEYNILIRANKELLSRLEFDPSVFTDSELVRATVKIYRSYRAKTNNAPLLNTNSRDVPQKMRWQILERDNFTCVYCGNTPLDDDISLHVDHVIAYSNGGSTSYDNLATACQHCNLGKSDKPLFKEMKQKILRLIYQKNIECGLYVEEKRRKARKIT